MVRRRPPPGDEGGAGLLLCFRPPRARVAAPGGPLLPRLSARAVRSARPPGAGRRRRAGRVRRDRLLRPPAAVVGARPVRPRLGLARRGRAGDRARAGRAGGHRRARSATTRCVVAQGFATLEAMYPGRAFVGIGSGESLNESPLGLDWPSAGDQRRRARGGARADPTGCATASASTTRAASSARSAAYLHTRPRAAAAALRLRLRPACGRASRGPLRRRALDDWPTRRRRPRMLARLPRGACEDAGREPGEIVLEADVLLGRRRRRPRSSRRASGRAPQPPEYYADDWSRPGRDVPSDAEQEISDEELRRGRPDRRPIPRCTSSRSASSSGSAPTVVKLHERLRERPARRRSGSTASRCCHSCARDRARYLTPHYNT